MENSREDTEQKSGESVLPMNIVEESSEMDESNESTEIVAELGTDSDYNIQLQSSLGSTELMIVAACAAAVIATLAAAIVIIKKSKSGVKSGTSATGSGVQLAIESCNVKFKTKKKQLLLTDEIVFGSGAGVDVRLEHSTVEPVHGRLELDDGVVYIADISGSSGVYLNGMRIQGKNVMKSGDVISMGNVELTLMIHKFCR